MSRILVLGASGMLGHTLLRFFNQQGMECYGTLRDEGSKILFAPELASRLITPVDVGQFDSVERVMRALKPQVVINAIGLIKQHAAAEDVLSALPVNSALPHQLAQLCEQHQARLIHISTDCVFSGSKGNYTEQDAPDALDVYGRTKLLGEVVDKPHAITLRTSIIGPELRQHVALLEWFLRQSGSVKGYTRAIFSGLPTVELAEVIAQHVLPNPGLSGLYHVAAQPISKYELLGIISSVYGREIDIVADDKLAIDRSLNAEKFCSATGYLAPDWPALIQKMHQFG